MLLALDWGNSNLRAAVLGPGGVALRQLHRSDGAARLDAAGFAHVLGEVRRDLGAEELPALAAGAVGAREGWVEAPYVRLPCHPWAGAAQLVPVPGQRLWIVPGLADGGAQPAILRGEEAQLAGAGIADGWLCLPGTHSKWVRMEGGRVLRFRTFMTGEMFALLAARSRLAVPGDADDEGGFAHGLARGLEGGVLTERLFALRAERMLGRLDDLQSLAALAGLLIGAEVAGARADLGGAGVTLCGDAAMMRRYARALGVAGIAVVAEVEGEAASWAGLWRIAQEAGMVA